MRHAYPDSPLFYRRLDRAFPKAVRAEGCWIVDEEGRRVLDAAGGAMVVGAGHGVAEIAEAIGAQARSLAYVNGTQFTHDAAEELAAELAAILPEPLRYSYFLSSGSEAIEAAVKLARQVAVERGHAEKWKVISRVPSYHGNTLAALALSGRESYRAAYGPLLLPFPRIAAPDPLRHPGDPEREPAALEAEILRQGADTVAAFIAEPVIGSSAGAVVPRAGYYAEVQEICRRHDVLFIADEVLCGMGRTGRWLASEHWNVVPDIVVLGKGLNGGYAPLSAVVATRAVAETIARGSGYFQHAQTYTHSPVACAAGLATLRYLRRERLVERAAALGPRLLGALDRLRAHPAVGDVRGLGLLAAVDLVRDRATLEPYPRADRVAERVTAAAFARDLIVWPNGGHVDGTDGDLLMVAPPLGVLETEIDTIAERLAAALADVLPQSTEPR
jgi:adenosylmethionine-8-amino-7-oxononanoate aminotransferase